ncbi:MAG: aldehyde dehydrogenase family protein, partial [Microthrixaceae bacterium]
MTANLDIRNQNLIGGKWLPSVSSGTSSVIDPSTAAEIFSAPLSDAQDVDRAVTTAAEAFVSWSRTTPLERATAMFQLADLIEERADDLIAVESLNAGKPVSATADEISAAADCFRFFAGAARTMETQAAGEYMDGFTSMLRREPVGVIASITPWNYPLMMAAWKLGPALAAGCTVVLKPSDLTPMSSLLLAELTVDVLPAGVFNLVCGDGATTGAALTTHPLVDMISVTGSVGTGKAIAQAAAASLKRVHLELGGKAPVLVFDDADLSKVAEAIKVGSFWNAGQDCTAAARVIAAEDIHDAAVDAISQAAQSLVVGPTSDESTELGPVISAAQRERVAGFVERA